MHTREYLLVYIFYTSLHPGDPKYCSDICRADLSSIHRNSFFVTHKAYPSRRTTIVMQIFVTRAYVCVYVCVSRARMLRAIHFNLCKYVSLCICICLVHSRFCVIISDNILPLYYTYVSAQNAPMLPHYANISKIYS